MARKICDYIYPAGALQAPLPWRWACEVDLPRTFISENRIRYQRRVPSLVHRSTALAERYCSLETSPPTSLEILASFAFLSQSPMVPPGSPVNLHHTRRVIYPSRGYTTFISRYSMEAPVYLGPPRGSQHHTQITSAPPSGLRRSSSKKTGWAERGGHFERGKEIPEKKSEK